jgi:hypothetical protein
LGATAFGVAAPAHAHRPLEAGPEPAHATRPIVSKPSKPPRPEVGHVFIVNIENEGADSTYGADSPAPYLAVRLRKKGVFVPNYYGVAHPSLPNYIAQISGQGANPATQSDCQTYTAFTQVGWASPGQAVGNGCVYPEEVGSLPTQLDTVHASWKGYMEDMAGPCQHPALGSPDETQGARPDSQYATRHNPFMYFASIIDHVDYCARHVVALDQLTHDLRKRRTTANLSYITPDLCSDGHDSPCVDGRPGGLSSVNVWMREWIPRILKSKAFKKDGVLIITADEAESSDATACCGEVAGPNSPAPGVSGPGGGRIAALVISRFVKPGSTSTKSYNHYSLLAWLEDTFEVGRLGYANGARAFGHDVFKRPRG